MKRIIRLGVLLFVITAIAALIVNCSKLGETQSPPITNAPSQFVPGGKGPFKDHIEFSFAIWDIGSSIVEGAEDPMYDAIRKKLNITIKPASVTWDDYVQKIQIWAASGQLPDLFAVDFAGTSSFDRFVADKLVQALPDDLSAYPHLKKVMEIPENQAFKHKDGKFYSIPRMTFSSPDMLAGDKTIYIRKDWMEQVGMTKEPESLDEFIALMKAFVEKDPDQNGKDDTIGLTAYSPTALLNLMLSYEPGLASGANKWIKEGGEWIPALFSKNVLPGIQAFKKMYDEGALDKDVALIKGNEGLDKFTSGKAGAITYNGGPGMIQYSMEGEWDKANPGKKITDSIKMLHFWKAPDGNYYRPSAMLSFSENYISAKVDAKKLDRILRFIDYFLTDEGLSYSRYGLEGLDYTKEGNEVVLIEKKDAEGKVMNLGEKYNWTIGLYNISTWDGDYGYEDINLKPEIKAMGVEFLEWMQKNAIPVETNYQLNFLDYPSKNTATANVTDDVMSAMLSKDVEKTWEAIVQNHLDDGYSQVIKEVNAAAVSAGIH